MLTLILSSCSNSRMLIISTQNLEKRDSQLIVLLLKESDFGEHDKFSLSGSITQSTSSPSKPNGSDIENASLLVSGDYEHNGSDLFVTIRHDLWLYSKISVGQLPTMTSQFDEAQLYRLSFGEQEQYLANCTTALYFGGAIQCEVLAIFGNLASTLNFTFPTETSEEMIKEIVEPIVANIDKRIDENFSN